MKISRKGWTDRQKTCYWDINDVCIDRYDTRGSPAPSHDVGLDLAIDYYNTNFPVEPLQIR